MQLSDAEDRIIISVNGELTMDLPQSETLCTWRSSVTGTWEVSLVPDVYPGRLGKANAV